VDFSGRPLIDTAVDRDRYVHRPVHDELVRLARRGTNALVVGARGAGKTTLLNMVAGSLEQGGAETVSVDGRLVDSAEELFRWIQDQVAPTSEDGMRRSTPRPSAELARALGALRRLTIVSGDQHRLVLCDELPPPVVHATFGRLRDEIWQLPFTWLVAGDAIDEGTFLMPPADAFFERRVRLESFSVGEVQELLERRAQGPIDRWVGPLSSADRLTPREALRRASTLAQSSDPGATLAGWATLQSAVAGLGRSEAMVFAELVSLGPVSASDERLLGRLGWTRERAVQVLGRLYELGFVETFSERLQRGRPRKMYRVKAPE